MIRLRQRAEVDADIAVAGAGPAGAAVAFYFARAGYRVLLIDHHAFPRDKVCGDFVGPAALAEIDRLGLSSLPAISGGNRIGRAAVFLDGRKLASSEIPSTGNLPNCGLCIPRLVLDEVLVRRALSMGCELIENTRVTGYEYGAACVKILTESNSGQRRIRARLLVGADGSSSTIARLIRGAPAPRRDRIIAVRAYYQGVSGPGDRADLYFSASSFPGYYWLFPTRDGEANVGVGMLLETWPSTQQQLAQLLKKLIAEDPAIRSRLRLAEQKGKTVGWPLVTFDPQLSLVADRVALVGDAAGLINPLNGEGIQYALQSARWLAESLCDAVRRDSLDVFALDAYVERVYRELRYDMAITRLVVDLISNRALTPVWLLALRIMTARAGLDSEYARMVGGILAGIFPARDALSARIVLATVLQGMLMFGYSLSTDALHGPRGLTKGLRSLASLGVDIARDVAAEPSGALKWGGQCLRDALECGSEMAVMAAARLRYPKVTNRNANVRISVGP